MRQNVATPDQETRHGQHGRGGRHDEPPRVAAVVVGSQHGTVWALRADTGATLWRHATYERLGALLNDGTTVYIASYFQGMERIREREPEPTEPRERVALAKRQRVSHHGTLTALRASDGAVRWQREGWLSPHGRQSIHAALVDGLLLTDVLGHELGRHQVVALDPATGETRWSYDIGGPWGTQMGLGALCGAYAFVRTDDEEQPARVLDARTGDVVRRLEASRTLALTSPEGTFAVITPDIRSSGNTPARVVRMSDGLVVAEVPSNCTVSTLSDEGVAYVALRTPKRVVTAAMHLPDWTELWRNGHITAWRLRLDGVVLYHSGLTDQKQLAEVGRLDPNTGNELWRWHSPGNIFALLRVWGRHTLDVLARVLVQLRRDWRERRARKQRLNRYDIMQELRNGKWRHPGMQERAPRVTFSREHVCVATEIGLYTLRASDGRFLWHALPAHDLTHVAPAVTPAVAPHGDRTTEYV